MSYSCVWLNHTQRPFQRCLFAALYHSTLLEALSRWILPRSHTVQYHPSASEDEQYEYEYTNIH